MDREKQKFIHFQVLLSYLSSCSTKNLRFRFRCNLGCARYVQSRVFFQNFQNTVFLLLYYSASKKATALVFNEVIEDILPFVLNTKRSLSEIWLLRYKKNSFGCFQKNSEFQFFLKTPKSVLLITPCYCYCNIFAVFIGLVLWCCNCWYYCCNVVIIHVFWCCYTYHYCHIVVTLLLLI